MHKQEIFICYENQLIVDAIQCFLNGKSEHLITGKCRLSELEASTKVPLKRADLIIIECTSTTGSLVSKIEQIKSANRHSGLLLLSDIDNTGSIYALLRA